MTPEGKNPRILPADGIPRQGLSGSCRLLRARDYLRVYGEGVRSRGRWILLIAAPGLNPATARMGLSVGRKFSRSAVVRNRARRVLREAFRQLRRNLPPLDVVLIPVASETRYTLSEVVAEMEGHFRRVQRKLACTPS
ncbi:MAG: ribonuclease P protein component [Planctomycetota bacterium]